MLERLHKHTHRLTCGSDLVVSQPKLLQPAATGLTMPGGTATSAAGTAGAVGVCYSCCQCCCTCVSDLAARQVEGVQHTAAGAQA